MDEVNVLFRHSFDKKMTVKELRALCKQKGIKGYSSLKRAELIELLSNNGQSVKKDNGCKDPIQITLFGEKVRDTPKPKTKKKRVIPIFEKINQQKPEIIIVKHPTGHFWCKDLNIIFDNGISLPETARKKDDRQVMIATGYIGGDEQPLPLDVAAIDRCKQYNIPYEIPEIIKGDTISKEIVIEYDSDDSDSEI